ncbi:MAG TPA: GNAT family N-acetyltransferase [Phytomonospora sp.]
MPELDLATVTAANEAWGGAAPEGSEVVETAEYRLVCLPERFPGRLQVQWVRSARPAADVLAEVAARAAAFDLPEAFVYVKLGSPEGFDEALLGRGAELLDTGDLLARPLPADIGATGLPGLDVRWLTTPETARDANTVGIATFGGSPAADDELARLAVAYRAAHEAGTGGAVVAYLDGNPVGVSGLEIADGVARLSGGGVLEGHRGRGVYRALLATRLDYAAEQGATMVLTQADVTTSSPILRRLGFAAYGQERSYRLPLN